MVRSEKQSAVKREPSISIFLMSEFTDTGDDIFGVHQNQLEALVNIRLLSPTITISDAGGLETKSLCV